MKLFLCFLLSVQFALFSNAQPVKTQSLTFKITGHLIDSLKKEGLENATITLFKQGNSKAFSGGLSNQKGIFTINDLQPGNYSIAIYLTGYQTHTVKNLKIVSDNLVLGDIKMIKTAEDLGTVTVTSRAKLIETKSDKMIFNAEKDITSQTGVATDILKKIPQVSVDVDGNVELQGNSNIRFLIDGKPSSIFGNNIAEALQSIPANMIKSIEVITSPGAKYDADGAGIINIILKKSTVRGLNGNVYLTGGTRLENSSANLNFRRGNFGLNGSIRANEQLESTTLNSSNRYSVDSSNNTSTSLLQNGPSTFTRKGYSSRIGFDWKPSPKDNLNGSIGYDNFAYSSYGHTNQQQIDNTLTTGDFLSDTSLISHSTNNYHSASIDWSLSYKRTFAKEGEEINLLAGSNQGNNYSNYLQGQQYSLSSADFFGSKSNNTGQDKDLYIQADYSDPIKEFVKLEAGVKGDFRKFVSNSLFYDFNAGNGNYSYDSTQSNLYSYDRNVYAAYGSISFRIFKFLDIRPGIRNEITQTSPHISGNQNVNVPAYDTWAPALSLSHIIDQQQSIRLSYTKRIQRPWSRSLNPYVNASDPKNISAGNPYLQPEITNSVELSYNKSFTNGVSIFTSVFYRINTQDIQQFTIYYPSFQVGDSTYYNVAYNTYKNIGEEKMQGLNLYVSIPYKEKLNIRSNLSVFNKQISNSPSPGVNTYITDINYRLNLNATYQFNELLVAEAYGNFSSARTEVQGKYPSFSTYSMAIRKIMLQKKVSIALTATNPFNKYVNQPTQLTGQGFVLNSTRQIPFRSFGIAISYKFGKLEFKKEKEENNGANPPPTENN